MSLAATVLALFGMAAPVVPPEHVVVVAGAEDRAVRFEEGEALPGSMAGSEEVWAWSPEAAPQRISLDRLTGSVLVPAGARLAVTVTGSGEKRPRSFQLVAAPAAMWQEIPEPLLPRWRLGSEEALSLPVDPALGWRLRLVGDGEATAWTDIPPGRKSVRLLPLPAAARTVSVLGAEGEPLPRSSLRISGGREGRETLASFYSDAAGKLILGALPDAEPYYLEIRGRGHAPEVLLSRPWPARVVLREGASLRGRVVDSEGLPVPGASVRVEAWLSELVEALFSMTSSTDQTGRFELGPCREARPW